MKTKFYRVCSAGRTIDGREVTPAQIDQMAETYNPATYGARVWVEHLRSLLPTDTPFRAYGDVLALKADNDENGTRVLLAQIDATDDLVKLNQQRQKVYWSIEIDPNFAGSGKAYLCGLAVTDTPASLGTEIIKLSQTHRGQLPNLPDRLYSAAIEAPMEPEAAPPAPDGPSLLSKVKAILGGDKAASDTRFSQLEESVTVLATGMTEIKAALTTLAAAAQPAQSAPTPPAAPQAPAPQQPAPDAPPTRAEFNALLERLSTTSDTPPRQPHAGTGAAVTDC